MKVLNEVPTNAIEETLADRYGVYFLCDVHVIIIARNWCKVSLKLIR